MNEIGTWQEESPHPLYVEIVFLSFFRLATFCPARPAARCFNQIKITILFDIKNCFSARGRLFVTCPVSDTRRIVYIVVCLTLVSLPWTSPNSSKVVKTQRLIHRTEKLVMKIELVRLDDNLNDLSASLLITSAGVYFYFLVNCVASLIKLLV